MKVKKLVVSYGWPDPSRANKSLYRVEKVVDSVDVHPGDFLTEKELKDKFIDSMIWNVTVVPGKWK